MSVVIFSIDIELFVILVFSVTVIVYFQKSDKNVEFVSYKPAVEEFELRTATDSMPDSAGNNFHNNLHSFQ